MHRCCAEIGLLLLMTGVAAPVAAEDRVLTAKEQFANLSWLEGHWRGEDFEAYYTSTEGWLILSVSKHYNSEADGAFGEFEQIAIRGGVVTLTPFPGGVRSEHSFALVLCDPDRNRVEFENLEHDWPTHFMYESPDHDTLHIVLTGPDEYGEGGESYMEWTLTRVVEPPLLERSE